MAGATLVTSRAAQVLAKVLLGAPDTMGTGLVVIDSWVEGEDTFCIVYRYEFFDGVVGLRRTVEPDWSIDAVVDHVLVGELGEPLGAMEDELVADKDGVMWWAGDTPEWKGPPR